MKRRRGITLLETSLAVSLVGILLASMAVLLTVLFRTEVQIRRDLDQQTTLARLNGRFRSDAHQATGCEVTDRCKLTLDEGRSIEYSWLSPRIRREVLLGQKVEHRDAFELPRDAQVSFAVTPAGERQVVKLSVAAGKETPHRYATPIRPAEIEALVNLHGRAAVEAEATP